MAGVQIFFVLFIAYSMHQVCKADDVNLYITADNKVEGLWVDGVSYTQHLTNNDNWEQVDTVAIPSDAQVIAVRASDTGTVAGVLASISDQSIVTDTNWKCEATFFQDWMLTNFDDGSWSNAVKVNDHKASDIHGIISYISTDADWIWTENHGLGTSNIDPTVYCRGHRDSGENSESRNDDSGENSESRNDDSSDEKSETQGDSSEQSSQV